MRARAMSFRKVCAAAGFALAMTASAEANDSSAELTTGGLVLTKSADIEMRSEDLSISEQRVDVHYVFRNRSASDVTVTVAFPMPDIVWNGYDDVISIPNADSANFLDFHVSVEGAPVATEYEQRAFNKSGEITKRLKTLGIPLAPQAKSTGKALDALPKDVQEQLKKEEIVHDDDFDAGKGMEHHLAPQWTLKTTFFWKQTFLAGRDLAVTHSYKPSVGGSAGSFLNSRDKDPAQLADYKKRYCMDAAFLAGVASAQGKFTADGYATRQLFETRLAYVLTTGANWAGPIGDFHLTIDKGATDSLISFCGEGVVKTSPTRFEIKHKDYTPRGDLDILILRKSKT